jgi:hypothetical protein
MSLVDKNYECNAMKPAHDKIIRLLCMPPISDRFKVEVSKAISVTGRVAEKC